ncbi:hypothetical protein [Bifidobacterium crudilactis]|uniref:hypothetical protein n=1 Tax=Bifidobacterium crudilactis TaxID=327277 RepID=UPI002649E7D0|nr:hypothetical protein [Bifidobacterium crudilactis]MDN5973521.1 hypothetical protein [Bifidobacterium crudilactis]MDN6001722.1 hypothetical protein [Bifidobacterium crudilactis]MDN6210316.1 hypothetical protein [Bifidobacterium crudilactis]MDN6233966.1 hypothetical protein [Bifidobacterium crudilactis]MDN6468294.1 hypothetical protein [Bifidobacterium crudilactis]
MTTTMLSGVFTWLLVLLGTMVIVFCLVILTMPRNYLNDRALRRFGPIAEFGIVSVLALGLVMFWPQIRDSAYGYLAPYLGGAVAVVAVGVLVHGWIVLKKDK